MHRNSFTMEPRFSLSTTSPTPIAESTCINGSPIVTRRALHSGLSPRQRSSSAACLAPTNSAPIENSSNHSLLNKTSKHPISRQRLNLSQIDPQTFSDVHSSGLASRIVKYHENAGRGLHRSMSTSHLYRKLDDLPQGPSKRIRSPLPYKASVPIVSMTRIAPPERSFYCGNTLPSLLRSNSVVGVHKSNEQLSRENRPIMHHPPAQDNEPTRSVLEALKEISRKRINTGDAHQHELSKKSCNRLGDFVDGLERPHPHAHAHAHLYHHQPHQLHHYAQPSASFKRQRELTVSVPLHRHHHQIPQHPAYQQLQINQQPMQLMTAYGSHVSPQKSPEQQAKRRNCSNDIASSLSSSQLHNNKRKLYAMRNRLFNSSKDYANSGNQSVASASGSSPESSPSHQAKIQRKQTSPDLCIESLVKTQSCTTPITPLPETPCTGQSISSVSTKTTAVPQRTVSAPVVDTVKLLDPQEKPKLTLFNAQQKPQQQSKRQQQDLESPDIDSGEYSGIQFVKPKQQNSLSGSKNLRLERTQKTKLAVMLSGLRGEIYKGEPLSDELDATTMPNTLPTPMKPTISVATTKMSTETIVTSTTTTTKASLSSSTTTTTLEARKFPEKPVIFSVTSTMPSAPKTALSSSTTATTSAATTAATLLPTFTIGSAAKLNFNGPTANNANKITDTTIVEPKAGGITTNTPMVAFGAAVPTTTTKTAAAPAITTIASSPMFAFGNTTAITTTTAATTASTFSFGNNTGVTTTTKAITTSTTTAATKAAPKPMFAFGSPVTLSTAAPSFGSSTTIATTTDTINFGSKPTTATTTVAPSLGGDKNIFSFGASNVATTTTTSGTINLGEKTNAFSFAQAAATAPAMAIPTTTTSATPIVPAFGGNQQKTLGVFGSQTNTFGTALKPETKAAEPAKPFSFGAGTTTTTAISSFGVATPTVTTNANISTPFGQTAPTAAAAPAATTGPASNSNLFGFGLATTKPESGNTSNLFAFGQKPAESATTTKTTATPFAFGGNANKDNGSTTQPAFGSGFPDSNKPSNNLFSFGGATSSKTGTSNNNNNQSQGNASPFAAGTATSTGSNTFAFGAAAQKPTPMFGTAANSNGPNTAAKPFAFGAGVQQLAQQQQQHQTNANEARVGGFAFGSVAKPQTNGQPITNGGNLFSNSTATTTTEAANLGIGIVKPSFSFGNAATASSNALNNGAASPAFGSFAAAAAENKPFGFGNTPSATSNQPSTIGTNLFASAVNAAQFQSPTKPGGFSFGGKTTTATVAPNANAPFAFGGAGNTTNTQDNNTTKPFAFGSTNTAPTPAMGNGMASNVFGSAAGATGNGGAAFSFGSVAASPAATAPQQVVGINGSNPFAFLPGTTESRPMRRAARRLQK